MKLSPELWSELSPLLDEGLELPADQRAAWLDSLTITRPDCAAHLRGLLGALEADEGAGRLEPPAALMADALTDKASTLHAGQQVREYRLVRQIGQGGMASVWLAEQTESVHRSVALKLPHRGLDTSQSAMERFAQERDLLAALEHPNIARLYDAGLGADGTPYLAMEWVDGLPLTRWCDEKRLRVRERLELFKQVIDAVQYAHNKLIIHRDLKASNVLVTTHGQVKLLDFGIAQMLHDSGGGERAGALTPDAASPEQLAGRPLGTPSDVYSLGVLLYELLCGARPYRLTADARGLAAELARTHVPALGSLNPTTAVASHRSTSTSALRKALTGELDAIVRKAMAPRAEDRYGSAAELAADLERHLGHWPVTAARSTLAYRARCHLRRNRGAVLASLLVAAALCTGTAVAWWQASRASAQAQRALAVQAFLVRLFAANEPERAQGRQQTARELLDQGARELFTGFTGQPVLRALLHAQVGEIYVSMGDNVAAKPHVEAALRLYETLGEEGSAEAIQARFILLEVLSEEGLFEQAQTVGDRVLALGHQLEGAHHRWALPARRLQAWGLMERGQTQRALELLEAALADSAKSGRDPQHELLRARSGLGNTLLALGRFAQARDTFTAVLIAARTVADYHRTDVLAVRYNLARTHYLMGAWPACDTELRELVPAMDKHLGPRHDRTLKARSLWAQALVELGRLDEAIAQQRANLGHARARGALADDVELLQVLTLAKLYKAAGRFGEGVALASPGVAAFDAQRTTPSWFSERGRWVLGELLVGAGQLEAGKQTLRQAVERARALPEHDTHPLWADMVQSLALAEHHAGATPAALVGLARALRIYETKLGADNPTTLRCAAHLTWLRAMNGPPTARTAFDSAARAYERSTGGRALVRAELAWMASELSERAREPTARAAKESAERALRTALGPGASLRFIGLH